MENTRSGIGKLVKKKKTYLLVVVMSLAYLRIRIFTLINFKQIPIECKKMFLCSSEKISLILGSRDSFKTYRNVHISLHKIQVKPYMEYCVEF